jgi:hypothetical protein
MNSQPPTQQLEYWRDAARTAELDLHRLRDGISQAIDQCFYIRQHSEGDTADVDDLIDQLIRLFNRSAAS